MLGYFTLRGSMHETQATGLSLRGYKISANRRNLHSQQLMLTSTYSNSVVPINRNVIAPRFYRSRVSYKPSKALANVAVLRRRYTTCKSHIQSSEDRILIRSINHDNDHDARAIEITINNLQKLNSLDSTLMEAFTDAIETASKSRTTRCIVIRGRYDPASAKTPSFSAGASLNEISALQSPQEAEAFITRISDLCKAITDSPVPVIAAIHGHCYGAGLEIAASCDVRYATATSKFAMPEVLVGIPSVVQARLLVDIMGWAHARHLMLFGRTISANEAYRQGLVNDVFDDVETLDKRVMEDIQSACECGPTAIKVEKELMTEWQKLDVDGGIQAGVQAFKSMWEDGGKEPKMYMQKVLDRLKTKKHGK